MDNSSQQLPPQPPPPPTPPPPPLPPLPQTTPNAASDESNLIQNTSPFITSTLALSSVNSNNEVTKLDKDNTANLSKTQKMLKQLLKDPLLSDLTKLNNNGSISIEEVDTLISLETGTAFEIKIERDGLESLILVVRQNSTISDVKNLIQLKVEKLQKESNKGLRPNKKISWKYIWKSYCLTFENQRLLQDKLPIQELGIRSGCVLKFSRFVRKSRKKRGIVEDNRK
ncbi:hypothetical protein C2G38_2248558 [Gigaspora rosea]|uniref:SNRNP25 ubiquitin-like domain-containing protein n=1 Tax=Gigaspora rosea TaxID=44941 RepID=A0A397UWE4_9GLOM|nr:hypothetical protein C2G38_2248558 [Gigaspora rosea]